MERTLRPTFILFFLFLGHLFTETLSTKVPLVTKKWKNGASENQTVPFPFKSASIAQVVITGDYDMIFRSTPNIYLLKFAIELHGTNVSGHSVVAKPLHQRMIPTTGAMIFEFDATICWTKVQIRLDQLPAVDDQNMGVITAILALPNTWSPWVTSSESDVLLGRLQRRRVCCFGDCGSQPSSMVIPLPAKQELDCVSGAGYKKKYKELRAIGDFKLDSVEKHDGVCFYAFGGRMRTYEEMEQICASFSMSLYSTADSNFTAVAMTALLKNLPELRFGFLTGFVRLMDGYWSPMDGKIFAQSDIADQVSVKYFGRQDLKLFAKTTGTAFNFVDNCVSINVFKKPKGQPSNGLNNQGVGIMIVPCLSGNFICQEKNLKRNEATLKTTFTAGEGCSWDPLGHSYAGNMQTSISGKRCEPWSVPKSLFFEYVTHPLRNLLSTEWYGTMASDLTKSYPFFKELLIAGKKNDLTANSPAVTANTVLPTNLKDSKNQCRNLRSWRFFVGDPVCLVVDSMNKKHTLEVCAVPLCASQRGQTLSRHSVKLRNRIPILGCENLFNVILTLGGYRVINFIIKNASSFLMCNIVPIVDIISFTLAGVSIAFNLLSLLFLAITKLCTEHKQMQLFYFNVLALVKHPLLLFFTLFRIFLEGEASFVTCLAGHQILQFAFALSLIAPVYPALSCAIGSLAPLTHHDVLSGKKFVGISSGVFVAIFVLFFVFPLLAYGTRPGPVGPNATPYRICDPTNLVPPAFTRSLMVFEMIFAGLTVVCLIVSLAGMIAACAKRNTWATSETDIRRDMEFFNLRLFFICLLRLLFNVPWILYRCGVLPMPEIMLPVVILMAFVWGTLNPLIFFFTDFRVRQKLMGSCGGGYK